MPIKPLSAEQLAFVTAALAPYNVSSRDLPLEARTLRKGTVLMSAGDPAETTGVVMSGVLSEFYLMPDGTERTRGFALPGAFFGSLSDALTARPSRVFVRTEANAVVLLTKWSAFRALAARSREWERMQGAIVQQLYLRKATREYELLALDAAGRYASLIEQYPTIETLVSQTRIASYLGITPVHLSRLRAKRVKARQKKSAARR